MTPDRKRTNGFTKVRFAYALPALPLAAIALPFYVVVPSFYAASFGLDLAAIGALLLAIRLLDAVTDPLFGFWSDRFSSTRGRRRMFFLMSMPLTAFAAFQLFWPPLTAGLGYFAIWATALSIGTTWSILPYTAWGAELEAGYRERAHLAGWREGFTLVGSLVAISLPFVGGLEDPSRFHGLAWLAIFILITLPATGLLAFVVVPEPEDRTTRRLGFSESLYHIRANHPFLRLAAAFLLNSFANAIPATLFLYFVSERLGATQMQGPLLFGYFLAAVAGVPLAVLAASRFGKHRAWCCSMILACAVFSVAGFLKQGDVAAFAVICGVTGLLLGFDLALPPAIQADVIDNDTAHSGEQRSGLYFAAWSFLTKLALALSAGIVFPLLDLAGFSAETGAAQSAFATDTLSALYAWLPIAPKLAAIALMWGFSLDETKHALLRRRLEAR